MGDVQLLIPDQEDIALTTHSTARLTSPCFCQYRLGSYSMELTVTNGVEAEHISRVELLGELRSLLGTQGPLPKL